MFFVLETAFGSGLFYHRELGTTKNINEATLFKAEIVDGGELKVRISPDRNYSPLPKGTWTPRSVSMQLL